MICGRIESEGPTVTPLAIEVDRDEVRRLLGYHAGHLGSPRAEASLDALWPRAQELLRPRGAWRVVEATLAAPTGMPDPGAHVGLGLCTIGRELESEGQRCSDTGDLLAAVILDAIGSAAAEAAADALNLILCEKGRALGVACLPRVSPGYGEWNVACQERLLALLPAAALGVTLTSGQMMLPRKSVSFAVTFTTTPAAPRLSPCARCGLVRCRHRLASGGA